MIERIVAGFITILIGASFYRGLDLVGWTTDKEPKQQRQTYLDYVKERLEVERLMK